MNPLVRSFLTAYTSALEWSINFWEIRIDPKIRLSNIDGIGYRKHNNGLSSTKKAEREKWLRYAFDKNADLKDDKLNLEERFQKSTSPSYLAKFNRIFSRIFTK